MALSVERSAFSRGSVSASFSFFKGWALLFIPYGCSNPWGLFNPGDRLLNVTFSDSKVTFDLNGFPVNRTCAFDQVVVYVYKMSEKALQGGDELRNV